MPYRVPDDTGGQVVTDTSTPEPTLDLPGFAYGDPIITAGSESTALTGSLFEFIDVVALDGDHAVASGQGGYALVSLEDGHLLWQEEGLRWLDVAWDPSLQTLFLGSREAEVRAVDLSDREAPRELGQVQAWTGFHEDLAAADGLLLVAARDGGAVLLDGSSLEPMSVIDVSWASAVGLAGDRAVIADGAEIVLYGLEDPEVPAELSRVSLPATGRDIDFDGEHVGVALGGHGVAALRIDQDALELLGTFALPGSSYGVALDGSSLWASAWSEVALIWLGEGGPVVVGTEPISEATLGIGAAGGRAVAADWTATTALHRVDGLAGPELSVSPIAWATGEEQTGATVSFLNLGAMDLVVEVSVEDRDVSLDPSSLWLEPWEEGRITVHSRASEALSDVLTYTSNDPDEAAGEVELRSGGATTGQPHGPLNLEGYVPPDTQLVPYDLADQAGRVTVLAYFTLT